MAEQTDKFDQWLTDSGFDADNLSSGPLSESETAQREQDEASALLGSQVYAAWHGGLLTQSGAFRVFHKDIAPSPEAFEGGPWFFEPNGPRDGDGVYSAGFATIDAALAAAEQWEADNSDTDA